MEKDAVRSCIEDVGIVPAVRTATADDAMFAAETVFKAGIRVVEITMTCPGALGVIADLARTWPDAVVGAGTLLDVDTARRCLDAGARFLTSPSVDLDILRIGKKANVLVMPGALTPTEVAAAWRAGADLVKVFPCAAVGGHEYIRALRAPFPDVPLVAAGGVDQRHVTDYITAGVAAVGVGKELVPRQAVERRQAEWITELARRFLALIRQARARVGA
jgi:2-dehydro-3-deoxyphosphogluconate aldolase/(4S)-4-hydroxy-2-oxoglutarate aldolase